MEFKRKFSTGPEAFTEILHQLEKAVNADGEVKVVDAVTSLARAIDLSDHYTRDHGQAVSRVAAQIARQMGLPDEEVAEIRRAGILHDIGKIGIPHAILYKPAPLTAEEFSRHAGPQRERPENPRAFEGGSRPAYRPDGASPPRKVRRWRLSRPLEGSTKSPSGPES